jgi:hypothetical protein
MKTLLVLLFIIICHRSVGQSTINEVVDKRIKERIEFIKAKTDSFLFKWFPKNATPNFKFDFKSCGYFMGEFHSMYGFLNSDKRKVEDINYLNHYYNFFDKSINLITNISVSFYFSWDGRSEISPEAKSDVLILAALKKIYNKGLLEKIKARIIKSKFENPYTIIEVDEKNYKFNIILKDKNLPHNYFII